MKKMCVALMALTVAACAKPYVGVPFTAPVEPITSVGILADSLADEAEAREAASVLGNFGLIGALISEVDQNNRKNKVNTALRSVDYNAEDNFEKFLVEEFADAGVTAMVLEGPDREKRKFVEDYPEAPAGVQALLDMNILYYGYANAGGTNWRPTVYANVRMVDALSGDVLLENRIAYNPIGEEEGIITLSPDADYAFDNRDQMVEDPARLAEGLDVALREVARTAVRLMR